MVEIKNLNGQILCVVKSDNLKSANLEKAQLQGVDLRRANLQDANLQDADLRRANLQDADLRRANLQDADLQDANLQDADLRKANLQDADLQDANIIDAIFSPFQIPEGELIVYKRIKEMLIQLRIPREAKRTACLVNRKCRAEYAIVENIAYSIEHKGCFYAIEKKVIPDGYDDDIRVDCTYGIHFFLTKEEADKW